MARKAKPPDYSSEPVRKLRTSPRWQADQERVRRIVEKLREAETAPPKPRRTAQRTSGRPLKFTPHQQRLLRESYGRDLKDDPKLARHKAAVRHVQTLAMTKFKIDAKPDTLLDKIIRPVLRGHMEK